SRHGIAHDMEFPVVLVLSARSATQRPGLRFKVAAQSSDEFRRPFDDLVAVEIELKWIFLVLCDLVEDVFIMARGIGNHALRVSLPGTKNRLVGGPQRGRCRNK